MKPSRIELPFQVVHWLSLGSEYDQANAVASLVLGFIQQGVPTNKIVILMRSVTSSGQVIADVLEKKDIPIRCPILSRGGKFTSEFIVPILDWLRVEHPLPKNQTEEIEEEQKARHLFETIKEWISAKQEDIFWDDLNRWREMLDAKKDEAYDLRGRLYDFLNTCEIRLAHDDSDLIVSMGIASQIIRSVEEIHRRRLQVKSAVRREAYSLRLTLPLCENNKILVKACR